MKAILIIADIGSPPLLHELLSQLPDDFGVPIVVLQSYDTGIFEASTAVFQRTVGLEVLLLEEETPLSSGCVYFARPQVMYSLDDSDGPLILRAVSESDSYGLDKLISQFSEACDDQLAVIFLSGRGRPEELPELGRALNDSRAEILVLEDSEAVAPDLGRAVRSYLPETQVLGIARLSDYLRRQGEALPRGNKMGAARPQ